MPPRKKSAPEPERRGHAAMKFNTELAEQFGITPGADPPRELVKVDHIPTPPDTENPVAPDRKGNPVEESPDDAIANVLREEMDELSTRLRRFGVHFNPSQQQTVVDYTMSVLAGYGGGGAIARR